MRWLSRLVQFVIVVAAFAGGAALIARRIPNSHIEGANTTYALFRDASRLAIGSPVRIAGVRVGEITRMTVSREFAKVEMRIRGDIQIPRDSFVTKRAESAFGDSYVEILPGGGEGAASQEMLAPGEPIAHVVEGTSTDSLLRGIGRAMPKADRALEIVHDALADGRHWANGVLIDNVNAVTRWIAEGHIDSPLGAADHAMERFESGTTRAADRIHAAAPDVLATLERYDRRITGVRQSIADFKTGFATAMADTREGMDRVDKPLDDAHAIMSAINNGSGDDWKGTLGKLVNDPELANDLDDLAQGGAEAAHGLVRLRSWIGLRIEYDVFSGLPRAYASAEIQARNDKYYLVEIEKGPLGAAPDDRLTDHPGTGSVTRTTVIKEAPRYTFQIGKRLGPIGLRGGFRESTFGVGIDALMLDGKLKFSTDLFGSFSQTPRLKVAGALQVFRNVFITAGIDDVLNSPGYLPIIAGTSAVPDRFQKLRYGRDYFLGANLVFDDDDLSVMLRIYGAMILGLIK